MMVNVFSIYNNPFFKLYIYCDFASFFPPPLLMKSCFFPSKPALPACGPSLGLFFLSDPTPPVPASPAFLSSSSLMRFEERLAPAIPPIALCLILWLRIDCFSSILSFVCSIRDFHATWLFAFFLALRFNAFLRSAGSDFLVFWPLYG